MRAVIALSFLAMQYASATSSFAQPTVNQNGKCNQANSGSGNNILKCYFYAEPKRHSFSAPSIPQPSPPVIRLSSSRCEPETENTVMRRTLITGDPGSGIGTNVSANPGDILRIKFQLGNRCYFRYCVPQYGESDCFNASVDVNALFETSFLRKFKLAAEQCMGIGERNELIKCMKDHGITRPPAR